MHRVQYVARSWWFLANFCCVISPASAANYTFTKIVDNLSGLGSIKVSGPASINDSGEVVFRTNGGIYKGSGGSLTTIAPNDVTEYEYSSFISSINSSGDVVYAGEDISADYSAKDIGIYKWHNGGVSTVYSLPYTDGPFFYNAAINDSGDVAFVSDPNSHHSGYNYYVLPSGAGLTVLPAGSASDCCWESPDVNNAGQVLYWKKSAGSGYELERYDGAGVTPIAAGFWIVRAVTMNNHGHVAFVDTNGGRVYKFQDGTTETVAGPDQGFGNIPSASGAYINDVGSIAFQGGTSFSTQGVYVGPDLIVDRVILKGDMLFGVPVIDVAPKGLNNNGQVLLEALLGGPSPYTAIVVATPTVMDTLPGDYNNNGTVDAADYVVWRKHAGTSTPMPHDPIGGTIGAAQYQQWRANFENTLGDGSGAESGAANKEVPEPGACATLLFFAACALGRLVRPTHN